MLFQAPDPRREREKERLKQRREAEERQRRAAASASAHAKAASRRGGSAADSPLLALPEFILEFILFMLGAVAAAQLTCEHSAFLGIFGRLFRGFRNLEALEDSLSADAATVSQHLAGLQLSCMLTWQSRAASACGRRRPSLAPSPTG